MEKLFRLQLAHPELPYQLINRSTKIMDEFMKAAIAEAQQGISEGGIPIGSVLVRDGSFHKFIHNFS